MIICPSFIALVDNSAIYVGSRNLMFACSFRGSQFNVVKHVFRWVDCRFVISVTCVIICVSFASAFCHFSYLRHHAEERCWTSHCQVCMYLWVKCCKNNILWRPHFSSIASLKIDTIKILRGPYPLKPTPFIRKNLMVR
jgi:hypothetical protein